MVTTYWKEDKIVTEEELSRQVDPAYAIRVVETVKEVVEKPVLVKCKCCGAITYDTGRTRKGIRQVKEIAGIKIVQVDKNKTVQPITPKHSDEYEEDYNTVYQWLSGHGYLPEPTCKLKDVEVE